MNANAQAAQTTRIALDVGKVEQLFSFDPAPDREHTIRQRVSEYLISEGWDAPRRSGFVVDLAIGGQAPPADILAKFQQALRSHFDYAAHQEDEQFSDILRTGRISLCIGIAALTVCTTLAQFVDAAPIRDGLREGLRDGLSLFGWVANWRPAELLLYDWWPVRRKRNLYRRLALADVKAASSRNS